MFVLYFGQLKLTKTQTHECNNLCIDHIVLSILIATNRSHGVIRPYTTGLSISWPFKSNAFEQRQDSSEYKDRFMITCCPVSGKGAHYVIYDLWTI